MRSERCARESGGIFCMRRDTAGPAETLICVCLSSDMRCVCVRACRHKGKGPGLVTQAAAGFTPRPLGPLSKREFVQ